MGAEKIIKLRSDIDISKEKIRQEKRKLHKEFVADFKYTFRLMDIAVALIILMNFGALLITTDLVYEKKNVEAKEINTTLVYKEINTAAEKIHNLEGAETEQEKSQAMFIMMSLLKQAFMWSIMLAVYITFRLKVYRQYEMYLALTIVCFYFFVLGHDFINDLGIYIAHYRNV